MVTARDIMTKQTPSISPDDTVGFAAVKMRDLNVGLLPVRGAGGELSGVLRDRDIVVRCIADGCDPFTTPAGDYAEPDPPAIDVDAAAETALVTMAQYQLHQLPVTEGDHLVGMLADSDVVQSLPTAAIDDVIEHPSGLGHAC
jgi:CBS domain-containing protein